MLTSKLHAFCDIHLANDNCEISFGPDDDVKMAMETSQNVSPPQINHNTNLYVTVYGEPKVILQILIVCMELYWYT